MIVSSYVPPHYILYMPLILLNQLPFYVFYLIIDILRATALSFPSFLRLILFLFLITQIKKSNSKPKLVSKKGRLSYPLASQPLSYTTIFNNLIIFIIYHWISLYCYFLIFSVLGIIYSLFLWEIIAFFQWSIERLFPIPYPQHMHSTSVYINSHIFLVLHHLGRAIL